MLRLSGAPCVASQTQTEAVVGSKVKAGIFAFPRCWHAAGAARSADRPAAA